MAQYVMEAFTQGRNDPIACRVLDWDYFFTAASDQEANDEAESIRQAFDHHNDDGIKWVEGPYLVIGEQS